MGQTLGLIDGPVLEGATDLVSGVIQLANGTSWGAKCAPLSILSKLFGKPKSDPDLTDEQKKEDGKKVIKVSDAVKIVKDALDGLGGTASEFADVIRGAMGAPASGSGSASINISHQIAIQLRAKALQQKNPEHSADGPHRTRK